MNVMKPLWSGSWRQKADGSKVWIQFLYERLQGLCYGCGLFGYEQKHCSVPRVMAANDKTKPKYGPFLNASKPRFFQDVHYGDAYKGTYQQRHHSQDGVHQEGEANNNAADEEAVPVENNNDAGQSQNENEGDINQTT